MMAKRRKSYDDYWWSYESTRPLDVESGAKQRSLLRYASGAPRR